jgi:hypothetical protein
METVGTIDSIEKKNNGKLWCLKDLETLGGSQEK